MNLCQKLSISASMFLSFAAPAFAGVVINSPANGADVSTTFTLSASAATCSSQSVSAMGYSFDSSSSTAVINAQTINAQVTSATGSHTLHVKAWGSKGASCVTDVAIVVTASTSLVPSNATSVSALQTLGGWVSQHDAGTSGGSTGAMVMTSSPSRTGNAREFYTTYTSNGGERYHVSFSDDETANNFLYDTWVYLDGSAVNLANLEMDINQTVSNGQTIIFGFQCDGWSGTWDFTYNKGTASSPIDAWGHTSQACNPRSWGRNQWHHIQVAFKRNDTGWVTYKAVYLDGKEQAINITAYSAFALGWGPTILTNLQVDGLGGAGSVTLYVDDFTIYRW